jgi:hypothetical protein
VQILETTEAQKLRASALSMLELLGFYEWFHALANHNQRTKISKTGKALGTKSSKTFTLDELLGPGVSDKNTLLESSACTKQDLMKKKRAVINSKLHRGEILSTKLVKHLGLGILFSPDIW